MIRNLGKGVLCLGAQLCFVAFCQAQGSSTAEPAHSTVAYVYVVNTPNPSTTSDSPHQIVAYAADGNGKLTEVPGSPFDQDVVSIAVNGKYLMAADRNDTYINAYSIQSDGSIVFAVQTNYAKDNYDACGAAGGIFFDHTGQSLYVQEYEIDCSNSGIASYAVDDASGLLNYLGDTITGSEYNNMNPASLIANNTYAYTAGPGGCFYYSIFGFERAGNGLLNSLNFQLSPPDPWLPGPPGGFRAFVPYLAAADTTRHLAMTEFPADPPGCEGLPVRLATYTADAKGNLSTASTYANMPVTAIVNPNDLKMSPSGRLLAVAGQEGLQVFHFNGAAPITSDTPLLTTDPIVQMFWDNHNHLYAISQSANRLHVFTVSDTAYHEAPGSPYPITSPNDMIVQPWPLPWMKQ